MCRRALTYTASTRYCSEERMRVPGSSKRATAVIHYKERVRSTKLVV
jgi:hypothetical protein